MPNNTKRNNAAKCTNEAAELNSSAGNEDEDIAHQKNKPTRTTCIEAADKQTQGTSNTMNDVHWWINSGQLRYEYKLPNHNTEPAIECAYQFEVETRIKSNMNRKKII